MHRSSSTTRASDEFLINLSPATKGSPGIKMADVEYDPTSDDATKKEIASHHKPPSGENVIHIIPLVLIFCCLTLWVFSHPVDITRTGGMVTEKVEGLSTHNNGNQTMKTKKMDQPERIGEGKTAARLLGGKMDEFSSPHSK